MAHRLWGPVGGPTPPARFGPEKSPKTRPAYQPNFNLTKNPPMNPIKLYYYESK